MTVRPRIQRAFLAWLSGPGGTLRRPARVIRRTDRVIAFSLGVPGLVGGLRRDGLSVAVEQGGRFWDLLFDEDVYPKRWAGQWRCSECVRNGKGHSYGSREALWVDHLFRPFAAWVDGRLTPAATLALFSTNGDGATWAELLTADADEARLAGAAVLISLGPADRPL